MDCLMQSVLLTKWQQQLIQTLSKPILQEISPGISAPILTIAQVDLPAIPRVEPLTNTLIHEKPPTAELAAVFQSATADHGETADKESTALNNPLLPPSSQNLSAEVRPNTVKTVYQQLLSDPNLDLQIALPATTNERNALLHYLYQCAGVQFALLKNQQLRYLSPKRWVAVSPWLRITRGALSPQERAWLGTKQGDTVRIFPQAIDQTLAYFIASALQQQKLSAFRASYQLTTLGLSLHNVRLNHSAIKEPWLVFKASPSKHCA